MTEAEHVKKLLKHLREINALLADAQTALRMIACGVDATGKPVDFGHEIAQDYFDRNYPPVRAAANTK